MTPDILAAVHAAAFSATRAWSAAEFAGLLKHSGTACIGNHDCFVLIRVVADEAEILTLATHPDKRRRGLARATLDAAETAAIDAGATAIFLEVAEDNTPAQALYETAAYRQVGRRPGYYLPKDTPPIAALVLRKDLKTG
jgi:ribosomal-protein-alanine N-acetyltransferase